MASRSYFGKMNSTLGSVVPLAMFLTMMSIVVWKLHLPPNAVSILSTLNADSDVFAFSPLVVTCTVTNLSMIVAMNWLIVMTEIVLQISFTVCPIVTGDRKFCRF